MFKPKFSITPKIANTLLKIENIKNEINNLPFNHKVLSSLRETAKVNSIHYSTMIEGNRLTEEEIIQTLKTSKKIPGRERDQKEVLGYYIAFAAIEKLAKNKIKITEKIIQTIHALVMSGGSKKIKPTPYRTGQNVIRDSLSGRIVYLPPESKDVPKLMKDLVDWINKKNNDLPCPIKAAIVHYEFATIHPYYDGNGRTARLLTTLILHLCGYDLKGFYSLEEYYAKDLQAYYQALSVGPSHNYYMGRAKSDITPWIEYFCLGMLDSFQNVKRKTLKAQKQGFKDLSKELRDLSPRQRMSLELFEKSKTITSKNIEKFFKLKPRTSRELCKQWASENFLIIIDSSKKSRKYQLNPELEDLLS